MYTFEAFIRVSNGYVVKARVLADNYQDARLLLLAQYGDNCLVSGPSQIG